MAAGFAKEVREDITPAELPENQAVESMVTDDISRRLQSYQQIQANAKLLQYCLRAANQEIGDLESNQDAIDSWAMFLYFQAKQEVADCSELAKRL